MIYCLLSASIGADTLNHSLYRSETACTLASILILRLAKKSACQDALNELWYVLEYVPEKLISTSGNLSLVGQSEATEVYSDESGLCCVQRLSSQEILQDNYVQPIKEILRLLNYYWRTRANGGLNMSVNRRPMTTILLICKVVFDDQ